MENLRSEALDLLRAVNQLALEEEDLFASKENCDYFRSCYKTPSEPKPISISPPIEIKPPPPQKKREPTPKNFPESIPQPLSQREPQPLDSFTDIKKLFAKIAPNFRLIDSIPKDDRAKQVAERWKTRNQAAPISLLFYQELETHQKLLSNLAQALDSIFGGARLIQSASIEKENQWEAFLSVKELSSVIICDSTLWQLPNLFKFYRELPSQSERFLGTTPLFLLPDLSLYLKDPLLKRSLWKALSSFQREKLRCPTNGK